MLFYTIGLKEDRFGLNDYISINDVLDHKVREYLCWPQYDEEKVKERIKQLQSLGVEAVSTGGPHRILGTSILGKGHSGIVIKALYEEMDVALKIRRTDSDRSSMHREANFLAHANSWNVGPRLFKSSDDFIVMELLEGEYFGDWVKRNIEDKEAIMQYIRAILDIAWKLDQSGLDHGELTRIKRHYIVTENGPRVIDFESASLERLPRNLTSTVQSLFLNYRFAKLLEKAYPMPDTNELIDALRKYKQNPVIENYKKISEICNL